MANVESFEFAVSAVDMDFSLGVRGRGTGEVVIVERENRSFLVRRLWTLSSGMVRMEALCDRRVMVGRVATDDEGI